MYLQQYIDNTLAALRAQRMANSDQLTLGQIISKCEAIAAKGYTLSDGQPPYVVFDFEYMRPTSIDSWRGIYAELALGFSNDGGMSLPEFIELLKGAVGQTFTGYKGGEFTMSEDTPVWVANYGHSGNTAVVDVYDAKWQVVLMTGYREN